MNTNSFTEQHKSPLLTTAFRYQANPQIANRKIETAPNVISQYSGLTTHYKYDERGHLFEASTRTCHEDYMYNTLGQRTYMLHTRKGIFRYAYDAEGKLTHVNDTRYFYDELGRLAKIAAPNVQPKYYTHERVKIGDLSVARLVRFQDSTGKVYTYSYTPDNPLPVSVYCNENFMVNYQWDESIAIPRLLVCATPFATWKFEYLPENDGRLPDTVILTGPVVSKLGYWDLKSLKCKLGYDHLGTVKLIADPFNELVKELFYDSFGNIVSETEQRIYFPLGFAGGLRDIATGFVCFGFRDYDPTVGRFTTPDPALDMRGDGDIYDYCVDDPVNLVDAEGLRFKRPQYKPNRNPGDARPKNKYQQQKSNEKSAQREAEKDKEDAKKQWSKKPQDHAKDRDVVDPRAEARNDLEEIFNAMKDGYGVGSKFFGMYGGSAGAAISLFGTKAAEKVLDNAFEMDIDIGDGTSISGISYSDNRSLGKKASSHKVTSPRGAGVSGKCTPSTQPRTRDGRFAPCGHAK